MASTSVDETVGYCVCAIADSTKENVKIIDTQQLWRQSKKSLHYTVACTKEWIQDMLKNKIQVETIRYKTQDTEGCNKYIKIRVYAIFETKHDAAVYVKGFKSKGRLRLLPLKCFNFTPNVLRSPKKRKRVRTIVHAERKTKRAYTMNISDKKEKSKFNAESRILQNAEIPSTDSGHTKTTHSSPNGEMTVQVGDEKLSRVNSEDLLERSIQRITNDDETKDHHEQRMNDDKDIEKLMIAICGDKDDKLSSENCEDSLETIVGRIANDGRTTDHHEQQTNNDKNSEDSVENNVDIITNGAETKGHHEQRMNDDKDIEKSMIAICGEKDDKLSSENCEDSLETIVGRIANDGRTKEHDEQQTNNDKNSEDSVENNVEIITSGAEPKGHHEQRMNDDEDIEKLMIAICGEKDDNLSSENCEDSLETIVGRIANDGRTKEHDEQQTNNDKNSEDSVENNVEIITSGAEPKGHHEQRMNDDEDIEKLMIAICGEKDDNLSSENCEDSLETIVGRIANDGRTKEHDEQQTNNDKNSEDSVENNVEIITNGAEPKGHHEQRTNDDEDIEKLMIAICGEKDDNLSSENCEDSLETIVGRIANDGTTKEHDEQQTNNDKNSEDSLENNDQTIVTDDDTTGNHQQRTNDGEGSREENYQKDSANSAGRRVKIVRKSGAAKPMIIDDNVLRSIEHVRFQREAQLSTPQHFSSSATSRNSLSDLSLPSSSLSSMPSSIQYIGDLQKRHEPEKDNDNGTKTKKGKARVTRKSNAQLYKKLQRLERTVVAGLKELKTSRATAVEDANESTAEEYPMDENRRVLMLNKVLLDGALLEKAVNVTKITDRVNRLIEARWSLEERAHLCTSNRSSNRVALRSIPEEDMQDLLKICVKLNKSVKITGGSLGALSQNFSEMVAIKLKNDRYRHLAKSKIRDRNGTEEHAIALTPRPTNQRNKRKRKGRNCVVSSDEDEIV